MGTKNIRVLAVLCGLALAASAPAAAAGTPCVAWQVGGAVLCEAGVGLLGYAITRDAFGDPGGDSPFDDTHEVNGAGALIGITVLGAYPLAAAAGTYFVGETVGGPAANGGATFGVTTFFAYAQTFLFVGAAAAVRAIDNDVGEEAYVWAFAVDAATKPVLTTYVYHKVKKPASPADSRLAVEPYVSVAAASDGGAVPLYGVTISF
jgi:hypothetical protein